VTRVAPIFVMSIAAGLLSIWKQAIEGADDPDLARSWLERLATVGDALWFYLGKLAWPHPLMMIYPHWQIDTVDALSYVPVLAFVIALVIFWLKRRSWGRPWFFALAYFLAALLPVAGLLNMKFFLYAQVADHFQYLSSMGPLALAGAGMVWLADSVIPERRRLQSTLAAGVLLLLGVLSWQRACVFQSETTLWTDTLAVNPNCFVGYNNLGTALFQKGQVDDAIQQYQNALKIYPRYAAVYYNIGNALLQKGQVDDAIRQFQDALKINPNYAAAYTNLGNALLQKGQLDEAIQQCQNALKINPNVAAACYNIGTALLRKGQVDEAIQQFQNALKIDPNYAEAYNNLGTALFKKGRKEEALAQFQEALRLKPDYVDAQYNLDKVEALMRPKARQK